MAAEGAGPAGAGAPMPEPEPLAVLLRAVGRYLIAVCPKNALTPDPAQPALRRPPPIFCEACGELADRLQLDRAGLDVPGIADGGPASDDTQDPARDVAKTG